MPVDVINALALAGVLDEAFDAVFAAVLPVLLLGDMTELIASLSAIRAEP
jgi:hypothetical protein